MVAREYAENDKQREMRIMAVEKERDRKNRISVLLLVALIGIALWVSPEGFLIMCLLLGSPLLLVVLLFVVSDVFSLLPLLYLL